MGSDEGHTLCRLLLGPAFRSGLVNSGFGSGPVGAAQMSDMRKAVQHVRAERMQAAKLGGFKPYSSHGAMGIELD